nr:hypothetical protein [Acidimicrobiia bacterium]
MDFDKWLAETATADIRDTLAWLAHHGFERVRRRGGPETSFGNVAVTHQRGTTEVIVSRDRGQWELHIRLDGAAYGIDLVRDVRLGRHDWAYSPPHRFAEQLPDGLSWSEEVPASLQWIEITPTADTLLHHESERRAAILRDRFP